jgi:hypothetical protein
MHKVANENAEQGAIEVRCRKIFKALDITIPNQIVVGFLQVTGGMAGTFSEYLPPFFEQVRSIFNVLAMDLVRVIDFGCTLANQVRCSCWDSLVDFKDKIDYRRQVFLHQFSEKTSFVTYCEELIRDYS